jgi:hypothetical protein
VCVCVCVCVCVLGDGECTRHTPLTAQAVAGQVRAQLEAVHARKHTLLDTLHRQAAAMHQVCVRACVGVCVLACVRVCVCVCVCLCLSARVCGFATVLLYSVDCRPDAQAIDDRVRSIEAELRAQSDTRDHLLQRQCDEIDSLCALLQGALNECQRATQESNVCSSPVTGAQLCACVCVRARACVCLFIFH